MMRKAIALTMALVVTGAAGALEVKDGLIKIVLHEDSGRFSAYYLADVAKGRYEALVFDRDPRTSSTNVYIDGILYRMGESTEFRIGSRRNGSGAEFRVHRRDSLPHGGKHGIPHRLPAQRERG
jgi:hypothetical protein